MRLVVEHLAFLDSQRRSFELRSQTFPLTQKHIKFFCNQMLNRFSENSIKSIFGAG